MLTKRIYNGTILSLDTASRKTGYAIYKNGKIVKSGTWILKPSVRFADLYNHIVEAINKHNVTKIIAEDIFKDDSKPNAYEVLAECRGVVECVSQLHKLSISFIRPIAIKQHIYGVQYKSGNTKINHKELMIKRIKKLGYSLEKDNADDEADAIGLLITYLNNHNYIVKHPK